MTREELIDLAAMELRLREAERFLTLFDDGLRNFNRLSFRLSASLFDGDTSECWGMISIYPHEAFELVSLVCERARGELRKHGVEV